MVGGAAGSGSPPDRWTKPVKIETFFRGHAQKIFSIKESIFAGFASLLTQGRAASHPSRSFGAESRRAKIPSPQPLPFCPPTGNPQRFFRTAGPQIGFGRRIIFLSILTFYQIYSKRLRFFI